MPSVLRRFGALTCLLCVAPALAQSWPAKPIHLIVPFAAGGTVDIVARLLGQRLGVELGQPLVIENKAGAGGTIAANQVSKAPPDGYTLMIMHQGLAFNASLYAKLPYDTLRDLASVAYVGATPNVLVVTNTLPVSTPQEFLAYARANPGKLSYGSGGMGSAGHLSVELLQSLAGIKLTHVPYKGSGPALTDLMSGEIQAMLLTMPAVMPFLRSGKLRAIATSGTARSPALPALPTLEESDVAGYEYAPWYGMFGPATLPRPLVVRLNQATNRIIQEPAVRDQFARQGLEVRTMTSEQFAAILRSDVAKWGKIIRDVGVRAD